MARHRHGTRLLNPIESIPKPPEKRGDSIQGVRASSHHLPAPAVSYVINLFPCLGKIQKLQK
jgi:hypothetical protein